MIKALFSCLFILLVVIINVPTYGCSKSLKPFLTSPLIKTSLGVEFEGSMPGDLTYHFVAGKIKEIIERKNPHIKAIIREERDKNDFDMSYIVEFTENGVTKKYRVENDISLYFHEETDIKGIEIVSPILHNDQELGDHLKLLEELKRIGVQARPDGGGNHYHYGLSPNTTASELLTLYKIFYSMGDDLLKYTHHNSQRGSFNFKSLKEAIELLQEVVSQSPQEKVTNIRIRQIRMRNIIRLVPELGTLEFRFINSTLSPQENIVYIDFVTKLMDSLNDPFLLTLLESKTHISVAQVSQMIGAQMHQSQNLLNQVRRRNKKFQKGKHKGEDHLLAKYLAPFKNKEVQKVKEEDFLKLHLKLAREKNTRTKVLYVSYLIKNNPHQAKVFLEQYYLRNLPSNSYDKDYQLYALLKMLNEYSEINEYQRKTIDHMIDKVRHHSIPGSLSSLQISIHDAFRNNSIDISMIKAISKDQRTSISFYTPLVSKLLTYAQTDRLLYDQTFKEVFTTEHQNAKLLRFALAKYIQDGQMPIPAKSLIDYLIFISQREYVSEFQKSSEYILNRLIEHSSLPYSVTHQQAMVDTMISLAYTQKDPPSLQFYRLLCFKLGKIILIDRHYALSKIHEHLLSMSEKMGINTPEFLSLIKEVHFFSPIVEKDLIKYIHTIVKGYRQILKNPLQNHDVENIRTQIENLRDQIISTMEDSPQKMSYIKDVEDILKTLNPLKSL